ncbi:LOW QUALITY PROTEIN: uncharacterized protein [Blastocystis hominis]|uniref:USP domain-containing protein n=1 Tax=Blastocystis hominis TaxID=12968 RepID=D8MBB8_BLAHO|nr:LOW QUALITY PROTEIN: uncharacterized protein [Blastocystis hominis]CBK25357.2 unnamed protein product [Blastocystis hominis]|eukprot:XP_012899405.1 LOW QUALITY PROTEIN: uncharacterized protein [Blastocystis hominis]
MINTDVQCDSHEFFDHLMASLKSVLESQGDKSTVVFLPIPLTSSQSSIDQLFSGKRLLCRCCLNCRKVFYRPDTFSFLDCSVVNMPRLEDALQVLFTRERMSGSEQYFCSSSKPACDAEVLTTIKELPPVLMIRMQRLQYDKGSGNQTKLTNGVQIPQWIDFASFSSLEEERDKPDGMKGAESRSMCWCRWCITTGIMRIAAITHGAWYLVNDQHVELISCPYVDCEALHAMR